MRCTLGALIIALVSSAALQAQAVREVSFRDLVLLAQAERERRASGPAPAEGRIYRSSDLARFVPAVPDPGATPVVEGVSTAPGTEDNEATEAGDGGESLDRTGEPAAAVESVPGGDPEAAWLEWQAQMAAKQAEVQDLEDREVRQRLAMTEMQNVVTGPLGTQQSRNQARVELATAEGALIEIQAALAQARVELTALQGLEPPR